MATYTELAGIVSNPLWGALLDKIMIACVIKATAIIDSASPTAAALEWAGMCLSTPNEASKSIAFYVVASNDGLPIATILAASDGAIQSNVNSAIVAIYGS